MNRRLFIRLSAVSAFAVGLPGCLNDSSGSSKEPTLIIGDKKMVYSADGNIFVVRPADSAIDKVTPEGEVIWTLGEYGQDPGDVSYPMDIATGPNKRLYICDHGQSQIEVYDVNGLYIGTFGDGLLRSPQDIAVGPDGNLYVADSLAHEIEVFSPDGALVRTIGQFGLDGSSLNCPRSLAIGPDQDLHVVDSGNSRIQVYDLQGVYIRSYGAFGDGKDQFHMPSAITIDDEDYSFVADSYDSSIHIFTPDGTVEDVFTPAFPDGSTAQPIFITFTPDGELYVQANKGYDEDEASPPAEQPPAQEPKQQGAFSV